MPEQQQRQRRVARSLTAAGLGGARFSWSPRWKAHEGVAGTMADPQINLLRDGTLIASNNDWGTNSSASLVAQVADATNGATQA